MRTKVLEQGNKKQNETGLMYKWRDLEIEKHKIHVTWYIFTVK